VSRKIAAVVAVGVDFWLLMFVQNLGGFCGGFRRAAKLAQRESGVISGIASGSIISLREVAPRVDTFWMDLLSFFFSRIFQISSLEDGRLKLLYRDFVYFLHLTAVIFVVVLFPSGVYGDALVISLSRRLLFHRIPFMPSLLARSGL
jgi:hypothetical protein